MAVAGLPVAVEKDVAFAHPEGRALRCDLYRPPPGQSKRTAIVHLHGGGFVRGSKEGARLASRLAGRGYLGVASQYRLAQEARWPAQIEDVEAALVWTASRADELGIDPDKIVVLGHSAGGRLALIAAGRCGRARVGGDGQASGTSAPHRGRVGIAACVAFYPSTADARPGRGLANPVLGPEADASTRESFSPAHSLTADFPPTLLLHGTADQTIPLQETLEFYARLREAGVATELHAIEGVTHVFDAHPEFADLAAACIDLFLDRHVVDPRVYPSTEPAPRTSPARLRPVLPGGG